MPSAIYGCAKIKSNRYPNANHRATSPRRLPIQELQLRWSKSRLRPVRMPGSAEHHTLLVYALLAVIGLVVLIAKLKVHPFIALTLASLFIGLCSGMPLAGIAQRFQEGVGAMLGSIAIVVGLGMILGKLLSESGGAQVVATTLIHALGEARLPWTMLLIGFLVGIPVFFTVGVVLLVPILFTLLKETRQPLLSLGIPMLAGLSVVHGLVPPHPGAMAAIGITKADPGKTILYSLGIGFAAAVVAGPLLGRFLAKRVQLGPAAAVAREFSSAGSQVRPPCFLLAVFTITLPVLLMLLATMADLLLAKNHPARQGFEFIGSPVVAMLMATLFSFYSFGTARGFRGPKLLHLAESCLAPAGSILLVVGAGGGFNKVLVSSGVGEAITSLAQSASVSPLLLGWGVAALIRVATGSATVAITTAAGIAAPFAATVPGTNMELLVVATGAGSLILSHVNDGGFWFVKEYFGLTVTQTLRTWTVMETIISVVALFFVLLVNWL
jgi:gluconate:H+ symporter, GntP family